MITIDNRNDYDYTNKRVFTEGEVMKLKKKLFTIISVLTLILFLAACNHTEKTQSSQEANRNQLTIFTTIYPLKYFTERIGGDMVTTENIVPPGSDAHSVEINTKTMMKIAESDALIQTGTGLEGFADSVVDSLKKEDVLNVNATENINFRSSEEETLNEEDHDEHGDESDKDPHVWLDPKRSIIMAENIKNALVQLKPENKEEFENNFSTLKTELIFSRSTFYC
jgi:zinc transport system substrate-binding protein